MDEKPTSPPMGRPPITRDNPDFWKQMDTLCQMHCSQEEIAFFFQCDVDTITNRCKAEKGMTFSEYFKIQSVGGRMSLRRWMWEAAQPKYDAVTGKLLEKGNATMQIFLSKQPEHRGGLGFSDRSTFEPGGVGDGSGTYEKMMGIVHRLEDRKRKQA